MTTGSADTRQRLIGAAPTSLGAPNGASRTHAFDRWFRYPAGFSPAALNAAFGALALTKGDLVVDPFAGVATAGTTARNLGLRFRGIEAHPLVAELANLKLKRPKTLRDTGQLVDEASALTASVCQQDVEAEHELVRRCFDAQTLSDLVALRESIRASENPYRTHLKWALLGTLREAASVEAGWPHQRPNRPRRQLFANHLQRFVDRAAWIAQDLEVAPFGIANRVVVGDARLRDSWRRALGGELATGCVSSPPYLNNFDYADATRLELYFWGEITTWAEMCTEVRDGMLVATTQQSSVRIAEDAWRRILHYELGSALKPLADELGDLRRFRGRAYSGETASTGGARRYGKEYDRVLPSYFAGAATVLRQLFGHLIPGAKAAWVVGDSAPYGVYIDTPRLLGQLAEEIGFSVTVDVTIRSRGERWRTNGTRHQVPLSERLLVLRRP